jgi:hypothetical protein
MLWVRPLDSRVAQALGGTEGATYPFWSADSRFIAFLAQNKLKKIGVAGGEVVTLCDASFGSSGAWNRDDVILFTPNGNSPLYRVSASGGTPTQVTTLETASGDVQHSFPFFLPDGRHFLYFVVGSQASPDCPARRVLSAHSIRRSRASSSSRRNERQVCERISDLPAERRVAGAALRCRSSRARRPARALVDQVQTTGPSASDVAGAFTVSETGVLAYQTESLVRSQLTWFDRAGTRSLRSAIQRTTSTWRCRQTTRGWPSASWIRSSDSDLWIFDVGAPVGRAFYLRIRDDFGPNWSRPDGDRIFFSSLAKGSIDLYEKPSSGLGSETLCSRTTSGSQRQLVPGRSVRCIRGWRRHHQPKRSLGAAAVSATGGPPRFLETRFLESQGQFSPDGRWVAFMSFKSGRAEVYVTGFPGHDTEQQGVDSRWRAGRAGTAMAKNCSTWRSTTRRWIPT